MFPDLLKLVLETRGYQGPAIIKLNRDLEDMRINCLLDEQTLVFLQIVLFDI